MLATLILNRINKRYLWTMGTSTEYCVYCVGDRRSKQAYQTLDNAIEYAESLKAANKADSVIIEKVTTESVRLGRLERG